MQCAKVYFPLLLCSGVGVASLWASWEFLPGFTKPKTIFLSLILINAATNTLKCHSTIAPSWPTRLKIQRKFSQSYSFSLSQNLQCPPFYIPHPSPLPQSDSKNRKIEGGMYLRPLQQPKVGWQSLALLCSPALVWSSPALTISSHHGWSPPVHCLVVTFLYSHHHVPSLSVRVSRT